MLSPIEPAFRATDHGDVVIKCETGISLHYAPEVDDLIDEPFAEGNVELTPAVQEWWERVVGVSHGWEPGRVDVCIEGGRVQYWVTSSNSISKRLVAEIQL